MTKFSVYTFFPSYCGPNTRKKHKNIELECLMLWEGVNVCYTLTKCDCQAANGAVHCVPLYERHIFGADSQLIFHVFTWPLPARFRFTHSLLSGRKITRLSSLRLQKHKHVHLLRIFTHIKPDLCSLKTGKSDEYI